MIKKIDVEEFKTLFDVLDDGTLLWKVNRGKGVKAGDEAGCVTKHGYRQVYVKNVPYYAHRIVLALTLGRDVSFVDHVDGNKTNNKPSNLKEVTQSQNAKNRVGKNLGASLAPSGWASSITVNYVSKHLGYFNSKEEAQKAYLEAKTIYHPEAHFVVQERNLNGTTNDC